MARGTKISARGIADELRIEIVSGQFRSGAQLIETSLAELYHVSRTIVRDALHILETEGSVKIIPNRGAFTVGFTVNQVTDIFTLRGTLEPLSARLAITRCDDEELETLERHLEVLSLYTSSKDIKRLEPLNAKFHRLVAEAAHSPLLFSSLRQYHIYSRKSQYTVKTIADNLAEIYYEHASIFEAFLERDAEAGSKAMATHIKNATRRAGF
jgi:DNA-binding GntR family transcriptional regulator